jgi:hypothetical protein
MSASDGVIVYLLEGNGAAIAPLNDIELGCLTGMDLSLNVRQKGG